jgi:hypothetical protein
MQLKKIIGFDSWTLGSVHYSRLVDDFKKNGYELILIHIGSWGHQKNIAVEELQDGLLIRDISFYKKLSLLEILKKENPSAILFLSTRAFIHQAINRYAKLLKIPTIHLYHGLVNVQALDFDSNSGQRVSARRQISLIKKRFFKNLFIILPKYCICLFKTQASYSEWIEFINELFIKAIPLKRTLGYAPRDTTTDVGCVYAPIDIEHMVTHYHMNKDNVHAVGNPDLIHFNLKDDVINYGLTDKYIPLKKIMYIDTSLVEVGFCFDDIDQFIEHIIQTKIKIESQGYNFIIKLHPVHYKNGVVNKLTLLNIDICEKDSFVNKLKECACVITEPSSAAMIPALMSIPLLLAKYGKLSKIDYGVVLNSYPRSRILDDISKVDFFVNELNVEFNKESIHQWNTDNIGPFPSDKMPVRVVNIVNKIVNSYELDK